jgi:hypothetical protein
MAYNFNGTNQNLSVASAPVTAQSPLTISIWFNKNSTTTKNIVFLQPAGSGALGLYNNGSSLRHYTSGSAVADFSLGTFSANVWNHAVHVSTSTTSRFGALNGIISGVDTTSLTVNTFTRFTIGSIAVGASPMDGLLAEVGIWNVALTADEIASLAKGMTCDKVRPQSLVFYAPLVRELQDVRGGLTITNNNTATVANHPRVYA